MKKTGSLLMLAILITSVIPHTVIGFSEPINNDSVEVNATGTRGNVNNQSVTFTSGECVVPGNLYSPDSGSGYPAVVFGVGYSAYIAGLYNSTSYGWLGEGIASEGYVVLVIRYCINFTNPEIVFDYSSWVNMTSDAITALTNNGLKDQDGGKVSTSSLVDEKRIGLGGHSIGGAVSIVAGAQDPRVKSIFVMSPQNYAGQPRMNDFVGSISPVPIQFQVGELDEFGGVATVRQSYNQANTPKEIVTYRYGTYEGFTDYGSAENIQLEDLPQGLRDILEPVIQESPLSTKQQDMSLSYTSGFLDYYLKNHRAFDFDRDYSEDYIVNIPPAPPQNVPDLWNATVTKEGLDQIFHGISIQPETLDFAEGNMLSVSAKVAPRGIWETGVEINLVFPESASENYNMEYNSTYGTESGNFYIQKTIPISHSLGTVELRVNATDNDEETYSSAIHYLDLTTTSDRPEIDSVVITPEFGIPGEEITFTIHASDPDGISYYFFDCGDGDNSGWIESNSYSHTYSDSGNYQFTGKAKDSQAQESYGEDIDVPVSNAPKAKLEFDSSVEVGKKVKFDAGDSNDEDGDEISYYFDFGDDENTGWISTPTATHKYSIIGKYDVTLKVRDEYGVESDNITKTIKVKEEDEDESTISSISSSSGFPFMIIIIAAAFIGGGYLLFMGGEEEKKGQVSGGSSSGPGKKKTRGKGTVYGKRNAPTQQNGKQTKKSCVRGREKPGPKNDKVPMAKKLSGGKERRHGVKGAKVGDKAKKSPEATEGKQKKSPEKTQKKDKIPRPQGMKGQEGDGKKSGRKQESQGKSGAKDERRKVDRPQKRAHPQKRGSENKPDKRSVPPPSPQPQKPKKERIQKERETREPEIDAPAIEDERESSGPKESDTDKDDEETEESWDDALEEEDVSGEEAESGEEPWDDDDFAIPVALKKKLEEEEE